MSPVPEKMEASGLKRDFLNASAGAIAGAVSRTFTAPLDVIKIRFQVQLEPTSTWKLACKQFQGQSKYTSTMQATKDIFREEGLAGFWRGNVPGILMYMQYATIQFAVHHKIKTFAAGSIKSEDHKNLSWYLSYVSGGISGCAATIGSYPCDLARTVMASQGEPRIHPNLRSTLMSIHQQRGIRGLYSGLPTTLVEIVPYASLQFGLNDTFKKWARAQKVQRSSGETPTGEISIWTKFFCGLASGSFAKTVCHPLDVVKKRLQIEGMERDLKYGARLESHCYQNMFTAIHQIARTEGLAGFYKGLAPSLIKAAPAAAITFTCYDVAYQHLESHLS